MVCGVNPITPNIVQGALCCGDAFYPQNLGFLPKLKGKCTEQNTRDISLQSGDKKPAEALRCGTVVKALGSKSKITETFLWAVCMFFSCLHRIPQGGSVFSQPY